MKDHVTILVNGDKSAVDLICRTLRDAGHAVTSVSDPLGALNEARLGGYDVVITSLGEDPDQGMAILRAARHGDPTCQVIVIAAESDPAQAVAAMREGALYYLQEPVDPLQLNSVADRAAERALLERDHAAMQDELTERYAFENIVGRGRPMRKVFKKIAQVARTRATVLIQGETGTGKELVARAIHYNSPRRSKRFVPLNCAGIAQSIIESELFGHEKGAFTGAANSRVGLFEYASNGTLFLDEIGDMPPASQSKLLRVLEHGKIVRVGSNEPITVDVRLIAATNQNLEQLVKDGSFRQDLFYRLNVITINLPPLRERQSDIALLIEHFLRELGESYQKPISDINPGARKALFRYSWPGNVRELRNCIEHMVVAAAGAVLTEEDLPEYMLQHGGGLLEPPPSAWPAGRPLEEVEKQHIARTLELVDGNRERAADLLGIGERTLYRKIQKYELR